MEQTDLAYCVYLVRLWQVGTPDRPAYRIALERPGSVERYVFRDLPSLSAFFEEQARRLCYPRGLPPDE